MNQHSSTDSSTSSSNGESAEAVSRRAYEIWEREGRPEGCDLRHWLQAEQELNIRRSDSTNETENSGASRFAASHSPSGTTAESRPAQTQNTRPTGNRENKRSSTPPFGNDRNASGTNQSAKKKPANAPMM